MNICASMIETLLTQANSLPVDTRNKTEDEDDICMDDKDSKKKKDVGFDWNRCLQWC